MRLVRHARGVAATARSPRRARAVGSRARWGRTARDAGSTDLVQQLVERVLARRPRLAEDHLARRRLQRVPVDVDALPVALHLELLDVAGEER